MPSPTAEDAEVRASLGTPLEELSGHLQLPEEEAEVTELTELYNTAVNSKHLFSEIRHSLTLFADTHDDEQSIVSKWRQKERLKTTAVALVMCLNLGVDPPDVIKISPCARMECWIDPMSMQAPKALDTIGKNLQTQYERWQPRAKYKMHLDPTTEDVKKLLLSSRRSAKTERVLFHYNGHGVPRPTSNGEIWVFNKSYTQYIPLSIYDLQAWIGFPAIYVFDCSVAGQILSSFQQFMFQNSQSGNPGLDKGDLSSSADAMRDVILLCACSENELLPQNPEFPADLFTSCLTTPIRVASRWYWSRGSIGTDGITKELVDRIPGKQTDRRTPLGELNWIFTAITDTIAWNVLPRTLFQRLFRQDLLVASLFRNFLLAQRVMHSSGCTPVSHPRLPMMHQHPMWLAWDMAVEMCLQQLPDVEAKKKEYQPTTFFSDQLTAFELWLEHGSMKKNPPEQLPIVLQVLLSQVHRLRALILLGRFLDMGSWAVDLALSVGIFPYVLKLLQTSSVELRETLVFIWVKILSWDMNSQVQSDLLKDGGYLYFVKHLQSEDPDIRFQSKAQAAFVLAAVCHKNPKGQLLCAQSGLLHLCVSSLYKTYGHLVDVEVAGKRDGTDVEYLQSYTKWLLICLGKLCEDVFEICDAFFEQNAQDLLLQALCNGAPEIRAAAAFAIGSLYNVEGKSIIENRRVDDTFALNLLSYVYDASPLVRWEVCRAFSRIGFSFPPWIDVGIKWIDTNGIRISLEERGRVITRKFPSASEEGRSISEMFDCIELSNGSDRDALFSGVELFEALLTFCADPAEEVRSYALDVLELYGVPEADIRCNKNKSETVTKSVTKSNSLTSVSSFLPKTWQPKGTHIRDDASSRSMPTMDSSGLSSREEVGKSKVSGVSVESSGLGKTGKKNFASRSVLYDMGRRQYQWPLLSPLAEEEPGVPWAAPCPPGKKRQRTELRDIGINKCSGKNLRVRLKEQVHAINAGVKSTEALLVEPFKPQLVVGDQNGWITVCDYINSKTLNKFNSNSKGSGSAIKELFRINELYNEVLMSCTSDGVVSLWRYYSKMGYESLVTCWQSCLPSGLKAQTALYSFASKYSGGCLISSSTRKCGKSTLNLWDLHQECCAAQISSEDQHRYRVLRASKSSCRIYSVGQNDLLEVFDLREKERRKSTTLLGNDTIDIAIEIGSLDHIVIAGQRNGQLQFFDQRMSGQTSGLSLIKEITGHSRGEMTAMQGHTVAPIFATATATQVVKIWSAQGEQMGVVRAHSSILGQPIGPTKRLSFAPFSLKLASGGGDSICAVYSLDPTF